MRAAFRDDPVVSFIEPRPAKRGIGIGAFAAAAVRLALERREVYVVADGAAAAIWSPPDEWEMSTRESLPFFRALLPSTDAPKADGARAEGCPRATGDDLGLTEGARWHLEAVLERWSRR